ncbi:MAG: UpxY family transcription antiterminator [Flavipsychrobacter sp.]
MTWYVLYTKPRNEKKMATLLEEAGVEAYCPVREEVKQWSDRKKKVIVPVFTSYIFVRLADYDAQSAEILEMHGAVRFLWWNKKPGVVRDSEIEAIKSFLNEYRDADITIDLIEGQDVTVMEGPLRETEGKVIRVEGGKAVLHLKSIGLNLVAKIPVQSLKINNK